MRMVNQRKIILSCLLTTLSLHIVGLNANDTRKATKLALIEESKILMRSLNKVLNFINKFNFDMNIDGALGVVLAEVQLQNTIDTLDDKELIESVQVLIEKCQVSHMIIEQLPKDSQKSLLFERFFLNWHFWKANPKFVDGRLDNLGMYESWSVEDIMRNKSASYGGISSDECLTEILQRTTNDLQLHTCLVGSRCKLLMFGHRVDTGYILTHRLLYLQILRIAHCQLNEDVVLEIARQYCSLIFKEAMTNAFLGFPQHDIFLEQVVLCGMEGFSEFLNKDWRTLIVEWQSAEGCYKANKESFNNDKIKGRSANVIAFGCTDHATGLGAAALALNLRYVISTLSSE